MPSSANTRTLISTASLAMKRTSAYGPPPPPIASPSSQTRAAGHGLHVPAGAPSQKTLCDAATPRRRTASGCAIVSGIRSGCVPSARFGSRTGDGSTVPPTERYASVASDDGSRQRRSSW